jgi:hypothetical protein
MRFREVVLPLACSALIAACSAGGPARTASPATAPPPRSTAADTNTLIPAGFGSLHQEEISISVTSNALTVRALPLDEDFIRTLAPDSYRSMAGLRESRRRAIDSIAQRTGFPTLDLWYVQFNNLQQGEALFNARDVVLTNQGRDFRPLDVIGITPGFGDQRVRQGQTAAGIMVFDGAINPNQPLTLRLGTQTGGNWQSVLQRVETERSKIRSRAGR